MVTPMSSEAESVAFLCTCSRAGLVDRDESLTPGRMFCGVVAQPHARTHPSSEASS